MKVIYKKLISELIREEAYKAKSLNRVIDRIELTHDEFDDLVNELTPGHFVAVPLRRKPLDVRKMRYLDIDIVAVEGSDDEF
ncbi:TPA: hypothetical protein NKS89_000353 [Vibrio parahaemolyticus]|uniref:hypothetical protein n=1 Tax=Vibrio harveyi group TaxID=717610 RepID=UPI00040404C5|nr:MULTISPECIES: hypothetical protein [Vibrio harveyi group]EJL6791930.1 hypothetical protein [Vibrio alginolyticus]AVF62005.1 hypothetical protein AL537_22190 [Vibrio diabolicus]ELA8374121.1 hypothetical protein [Vibrio alginolyticus]ELB1135989.1 hypothetical protein [Vibrio parahaemolyticus]ELB7596760.1 hypothetical protein [Vibrio parahaemolyticus]